MNSLELKTTRLMSRPHCPRCSTLLDAATDTNLQDPRTPKPEDLTICIKCGLLLVFTADMSLRRATIEEIAYLQLQHSKLWQMAEVIARRYTSRVN